LLGTFAQSGFEIGRAAMLLEQVGERFVGEFLKIHHPIACENIDCVPCLFVEGCRASKVLQVRQHRTLSESI
jgi:hypothetical protein